MARKPARAPNDDIGEDTRLKLYRTQVVIREAEQRAEMVQLLRRA